ncbi:MAG TPA: hypothetical protein VFJ49_09360 [Methyloceanibacter sp.]|nr:hypothetical protein [Methyloceanibacter sp.]
MLRTNSFLSGLVLIAVAAVAAPKAKAETAWLGLVTGPAAGSEAVQAADIASLFEQDQAFRVVPMLGDVGTGNLRLLLNDPGVDIAFVSTDALAAAAAPGATLSDHLEWRGSHLRRFTSWRAPRSAASPSLPARK